MTPRQEAAGATYEEIKILKILRKSLMFFRKKLPDTAPPCNHR